MSDNLNELGTLVPKQLVENLLIENARLKAEIERLRNVGDAMADYLFDAPYPCRIFYHKWNDAKEGKQS